MAHSWNGNVCRVCGTSRRATRPASRYATSTFYTYLIKGADRFSHICPPCDDGQVHLFDRVEVHKTPLPIPAEPEPVVVKTSQRTELEMPVRHHPSDQVLQLSPYLSLEMDPDGRWGGVENNWRVWLTLGRGLMSPDEPVTLKDTFPIAIDAVKKFASRWYDLPGAIIEAASERDHYRWTRKGRTWKLL